MLLIKAFLCLLPAFVTVKGSDLVARQGQCFSLGRHSVGPLNPDNQIALFSDTNNAIARDNHERASITQVVIGTQITHIYQWLVDDDNEHVIVPDPNLRLAYPFGDHNVGEMAPQINIEFGQWVHVHYLRPSTPRLLKFPIAL